MHNGLGSIELGSFEYTFTDRELEDVLGFIERRQSGLTLETEAQLTLPSLPPSSVLQFQPHPNALPSLSDPTGADALLPPIVDLPDLTPGIPLPGPFDQPSTDTCRDQSPPAAVAPPKSNNNTAASTKPAKPTKKGNSSKSTNGKPNISHSTVEKQRRDRINALIDELRDLVPPQHQSGTEEDTAAINGTSNSNRHASAVNHTLNIEARRPKHTVLADTIALVKGLRDQLAAVQLNGNNTTIENKSDAEAAAVAAAAAAVATAAAHATPVSSTSPGPEQVEIAPGDNGCLYVKIHCKDRHGLLADIVRTLKAIPLEITTAAVTTTANGNVYDVFQVVSGPGTPRVTAEKIRDRVVEAMACASAAASSEILEPKRRRGR